LTRTLAADAQKDFDRLTHHLVHTRARAPALVRLVGQQLFITAEAEPFRDQVGECARAALGAVVGGDRAQQVGRLAFARRAAEDVQPRRYQTLLDLREPLPEFEHAPVSLFN
jgi:hypothetical protein